MTDAQKNTPAGDRGAQDVDAAGVVVTVDTTTDIPGVAIDEDLDVSPWDLLHDIAPTFDLDTASKPVSKKITVLLSLIPAGHPTSMREWPVRDDVIANATRAVLAECSGAHVADRDIARRAICRANDALAAWNAVSMIDAVCRSNAVTPHFTPPQHPLVSAVEPIILVEVLLTRHTIIKIAPVGVSASPDNLPLAVYQDNPILKTFGTYRTDHSAVKELIARYGSTPKRHDADYIRNEIYARVPTRTESDDRDLVPCENTIFDYGTGQRIAYDPKYVFTSKFATSLPSQRPPEPEIVQPDGTVWTPMGQIASTFTVDDTTDTESMCAVLQQMCAVLRPHVRWNRAALWLASNGNNGKGTLLQLIREIVGPQYHTSISLHQFQDRFGLGSLARAHAILTDENEVSDFMKWSARFKAVVTGDVVTIEEKNVQPIDIQFSGFMIQCMNSRPRMRDNTGSLYRRFVVVKFPRSFTGHENKAIKSDYIRRRDVREWVLYHLLVHRGIDPACDEAMETVDELIQPSTGRSELEEVKRENDSVLSFYDEIFAHLESAVLPNEFVYTAYKSWYAETVAKTGYVSEKVFTSRMDDALASDPSPGYIRVTKEKTVRGVQTRVAHQFRAPKDTVLREPVLAPYGSGLGKWGVCAHQGLSLGQKQIRGYKAIPGVGPNDPNDPNDPTPPVTPAPPTPSDGAPADDEDADGTTVVVFDLETGDARDLHKPDTTAGFVRLAAYAIGGGEVRTTTDIDGELIPVLESADVIVGHNIVHFDLPALRRFHGLHVSPERVYDTLIAARLLLPTGDDKEKPYALESVAERVGVDGKLFSEGKTVLERLSEEHGSYYNIPVDDPDYVRYTAQDVRATRDVYHRLMMNTAVSDDYIRREHEKMVRVACAEKHGVRIDVQVVEQMHQSDLDREREIRTWLADTVGSPSPAKSIAPERTNKGKEAIVTYLAGFGVDVPLTPKGRPCMEKKIFEKLARDHRDKPDVVTLCENMVRLAQTTPAQNVRKNLVGDRVYPSITASQATGRLSTSKPAMTVFGSRDDRLLQQRQMVLPDEGEVLISVDLSQIDARCMAAGAEDDNYAAMFAPGKDSHTMMAERVFGDKSRRADAKILAHAANYGMGARSFAKAAGISEDKAAEQLQKMQDEFPGLEAFKNHLRACAENNGYITNGFGRRVVVAPDKAYTRAPAAYGQSTARDVFLEGVMALPEDVADMIRIFVHDEIVLSVPKDRAADILQTVKNSFESVQIPGPTAVPTLCDGAGPADNWSGLK